MNSITSSSSTSLQVYGYARHVEMENNVIKVIKDKDAKTQQSECADAEPGIGDEMVTRIVALYNTEAKQLGSIVTPIK